MPEGEVGLFCAFCWSERVKNYENGKEPKSLGTKPIIEASFIGKKIRVETKSGAIYRFGKSNEKGIRTVHRNQTLPFDFCGILCLTEGKPIYLISIKGNKRTGWWITTEVLSILKY